MVASMTAFARREDTGEWGHAVWEIRTVNHRYLDISIRLPEELRVLEGEVRERISARLKRGKVECNLRFNSESAAGDFNVNTGLIEKIIQASADLPVTRPAPINPVDILRWPGVIDKNTPDLEQLGKSLIALLDQTLEDLLDTRRREGGKISEMIETRCDLSLQQVHRIREIIPDIITSTSDRHVARVREIGIELDNGRLEQEIALMSQKLDVAEELDRLETHILEVKRVLTDTEPVGRRLDFLMQEMNREANTLGSKSAHIDTSNASIELKVLVEQMREQIQNIE
ncbi:MAG: YicC family protein [Gammaproteobacteria bacterium]|nr:YicC family protein [Gammaproteobacteria bacterium]